MRVVFPFDPLNEKEADGPFREEFELLKSKGIACSLFDFDVVQFDEFKPKPNIEVGETIVYRGWMMNPDLYAQFVALIEANNGKVLTSVEDYVSSHHLASWYDSCKDFTAETHFFDYDDVLEKHARELGWDTFFVKDYVKSNYDERGSIAESPAEVSEIVKLIEEYRGEIEGGVALRHVENYLKETEQRYFVLKGKVHSPSGPIPEIVHAIANRHTAPFYSVDTIQREDSVTRLVELGDGQVSDRKNWDVEIFCQMFMT